MERHDGIGTGIIAVMPQSDRSQGGALAEFLRSRRDALTPEDVVVDYRSRRVPGLRREELAAMAGVSITYYTRMEQGGVVTASAQVLDALATALRLTATERAYLHEIARPGPPMAMDDTAVSPGLLRLITRMSDVPAVVLNRCNDVLAWNRLGNSMVAPYESFDATSQLSRPNLTRMLFMDERVRAMYVNFDQEAKLAVSALRLVAAQFPDDQALTGFIGEMCVKSQDFASLWAEHAVGRCSEGFKQIDHPQVGRFDVSFDVLHSADSNGQRLLTHTPIDPRGEDALTLLALTDPPGIRG